MLFSSKGKNKFRALLLLLSVICFVGGCFVFSITEIPSSYASSDEQMMYWAKVGYLFVLGSILVVYAVVRCSGFINVYEDHIEGKGLQGKNMSTFDLRMNQIKSVTQENRYICIHTDIGVFKILCDKNTRDEIMHLFSNL